MPIFLALRSLRQEDCYQFEAYKEMKFQESLVQRWFRRSGLGLHVGFIKVTQSWLGYLWVSSSPEDIWSWFWWHLMSLWSLNPVSENCLWKHLGNLSQRHQKMAIPSAKVTFQNGDLHSHHIRSCGMLVSSWGSWPPMIWVCSHQVAVVSRCSNLIS